MKFLVPVLLTTLTVRGELVSSKEHPKIKIPEGLSVSQFADRDDVVNATTLCLDAQGRVYVAETHRWRRQVQDIRFGGGFFKERLHDDISIMSLKEREAFHKKWSGKDREFLKWEEFDDDAEVIKLLQDTTGDGKADKVSVFRDDFNQPLAGPSSGLIEKDGEVYFAMVPGVYRLRDEDNDGKAELRETLVEGFGLRVSFSGHDLNGFTWGPDGKLYWSMGDRGYDLKKDGKRFHRPDSGGVFRMNPDGSDFEVFATNLRNPKELVFDEFGNLFTVDNDYDQGDQERIVYLVEHGDSGWKMGHQTIASFGNAAFDHMERRKEKGEEALDMWMAEGMWLPRNDRQPAHIIPPIANTVNGPCGLAYNPGVTGLPKAFDRHFFSVSYVANPAGSGIYRFTLKPDGASFKLDQHDWFLKGIALTDLDWGPDGKLYLSDYGGGWVRPGRGGVYTVGDESLLQRPEVLEVQKIFSEGITKAPSEKLEKLLAHRDQRIRTRAQFALAERGLESLPAFERMTHQDHPLLGRLHAIWGIGQLAHEDPKVLQILGKLMNDFEIEVRANVARTLGHHPKNLALYQKGLIQLLEDPSLRVVSLAALALANHAEPSSVPAAISLLARNKDQDVIVRHGAIMMLAKAGDPSELAKFTDHDSASVRRGVVVALRRMKSKHIAAFFDDQDRLVRQEAIRGAYDEDIRETFPALSSIAHRIAKNVTEEMKYHPLTARRVIHAAWTLGRAQDLDVITQIINDSAVDFRVRRDGIIALLDWNKPPVADPVTAFVRVLPKDRIKFQGKDLLEKLKPLYEGAPDDRPAARLLPWALKLIWRESLPLSPEILQGYVEAGWVRDIARVEALKVLSHRRTDQSAWRELLKKLTTDQNEKVRSKAREFMIRLDPEGSIHLLEEILTSKKTSLVEKQLTLKTLIKLKTPKIQKIMEEQMTHVIEKTVEPGLALDIVLGAEALGLDLVEKFRAQLPQADPLAEWKVLSEKGGSIKRGKELYYGHATAQCQRCHMMNGVGGDVGPELAAIGKEYDESYLLRALITPNSEVAAGYGLGTITLKDGTVISGTILPDKKNGDARIKIGQEIKTFKKSDILNRTTPMSAMPSMAGILTKSEARDIVAYLRSCKVDRTDEGHK